MELKVYNSEKFERNKWRYTIFTLVILVVILISLFYKNIVWIVVLLLLLGWYIYYWIINIQEINIKISENWLIIWGRITPWTSITWYCIEINKDDQEIKNIVIVGEKRHSIYTINDTTENINKFFTQLSKITQMLDDFPQTFREKFIRKLKL